MHMGLELNLERLTKDRIMYLKLLIQKISYDFHDIKINSEGDCFMAIDNLNNVTLTPNIINKDNNNI